MSRTVTIAALLCATTLSTPAFAQDAAALAAELSAMRAKVEQMEARLAEMEAAQAAAPAPAPAAAAPAAAVAAAAPAPTWRGAPTFTAPGGWSFKPRGRIQFDAGYVSEPAGISDPALGFANRLRRGRLGMEGAIPGGFGYRFELDFAGGTELTDAYLTYRASPQLGLTLGQHNHFQGLERMTSSNFTSFMERAAFTNAFNFERRVGLSANYAQGPLIVQGGVFTDDIAALADSGRGTGLGDENGSIGGSGRIVYAPKVGETQLHFGGSAHYRSLDGFADAGATQRYRQRPALRTHNTRFIGTPPLRVEGEAHYGLEAALIRGPFHAAGEVHWLNADTRTAGLSPTFFGGYGEVGYFLTGETRGYRNGAFDRTRVLKPVGGGGAGALQVNLRYDHLDLSRGGVIGGSQDGFLASLVWIPQDYVRFLLNAGHLRYHDAVLPAAGGNRNYGATVVGARAQIDF